MWLVQCISWKRGEDRVSFWQRAEGGVACVIWGELFFLLICAWCQCEWEWRETPNWFQFEAAWCCSWCDEGEDKHQTGSKLHLRIRNAGGLEQFQNLRNPLRWNDVRALERIRCSLDKLGINPEGADPIPNCGTDPVKLGIDPRSSRLPID